MSDDIFGPRYETFGPRSVTWQLHADPAMWVAGISSLFLEALHPVAVRGVIRHSDFRDDPMGRLSRTADFVGVTTYGAPWDAEEAAARVRKVHAALRFQADDGTWHRVDEPDLLLWIHCSAVVSYVDIVRLAGYPLTDAQTDLYLTEQRTSARLVGLNPEDVPGTRADMSDYFAAMRPILRRTPDSEEIYDFLMAPPLNPPLRTGLRPIAQIAYALLPPWAIELHGHKPLNRTLATGALRALRTAGNLLPESIRWGVPIGNIPRAIKRLGRKAAPSVRKLPD